MHRLFRIILSMMLAMLLSLQCFAASALLQSFTPEADDPVEISEPETDAPTVLSAQVRPADSDSSEALTSGMTLRYQTAVFHFLLSDPEGESGMQPSGVDLAASTLFVDECAITGAAADETDASLTYTVTLTNGRHALRLIVRDKSGNQSEQTYIIHVSGDRTDLPEYTVSTDLDYAPLGGKLRVTLHTSSAAYLSALNVTMKTDPAPAGDNVEIEAGSGFTLDESSVHYDAERQTLSFRIRANLTLTGGRDIATIAFAIPPDLPEGSVFAYELSGAWAESRRNDLPDYYESVSVAEKRLPVDAPYRLEVDDLYVGMTDNAYIRVTDRSGSKAYQAQVFEAEQGFLGITNWIGQLAVPGSMLVSPGRYVLYASGEAGRSFPVTVTVADAIQGDASPVSFRAQAEPAGSKTVSWISPLHESVLLRWAETVPALNQAQPIAVSSARLPFGGTVAQINTCTLTGLRPGAAGYLQISYDGAEWSAVEAFSTADFSEHTSFVLTGGMAGAEQAVLSSLTEAAAAQRPQLFVQIGDSVQDASSVEEWMERLAALDVLGGADLLLVPGANTVGRTASAVSSQPETSYSYEYGNVYFAVIPGSVNSAALEWLIRDASGSSCLWKVLLTSDPIADADRPALEEAGIHAVFTDGTYARSPALSGGQIASSYDAETHTGVRGDGVVYLQCGAGDEGMFLSVKATQDALAISAVSVTDGTQTETDYFTLLASSCVTDGHSFNEHSAYDHAAGTLTCAQCGKTVPARESGYTGFASMANGRAYLDRGFAEIGWFLADDTWMHAGSDSRVHETEDFSTEKCTEPGERMAWCAECGLAHTYGTEVPACGHRYNSAHRCTNTHYDAEHRTSACGWTGVDLAGLTAEPEYLYGYYSAAPLTPSVTVRTPEGAVLSADEYTLSYENNTAIGMALVRVAGTNSYYGELTVPFEIRPCDVESIRAEEIGQTQLTLVWDAALGAQRYAVYQETGTGWKRLGDTTDTRYTVTGLSPAALYTFRVRPFASAEFTGKRLDGSQDRTFWAPHHSESLAVRMEGVRFVDVPAGEWFAPSVQWAVDRTITNGTDATHFSPYNSCTRGQMVTFLWRAKGSPEPTMRSSPFGDVNDPNAYYYKAVLWAVEQGITRGSSVTTFSPDAPVTRGMVVTFLHRAAGAAGPKDAASPFVDVAPDQYYSQSVQWAVEQSITKGMDETHFAPDTICTRAQIVTFLYRFMNRS